MKNDEIDPEFGVVEVDPHEQVFTFLVEESDVKKCSSLGDWEVRGPFANPRIESFGPPEVATEKDQK